MKRPTYFCSKARCSRQWRNVHRKRCAGCGGENTRLAPARVNIAKTILVTPDIPEHFNITINQVVKSRRHLQDLQKRHGWRDYEGVNGASVSQVFGPGGEIRRAKHSEMVRR